MTQATPPLNLPEQLLQLGEEVADFELLTMTGTPYRMSDYRNQILVIDFWSAECPVSQNYDTYLKKFVNTYAPQGVTLLAIDSNDYEDEGDILRTSGKQALNFPILRDTRNRVADYFDALTTPHVFVFDEGGRLRYRGAIDDITFKKKVATVNYLEQAVDALLQGEQVPRSESEPYGCTINRYWEEME